MALPDELQSSEREGENQDREEEREEMKLVIESTSKIVELDFGRGAVVPARIWEGETDTGIRVHCYITRVAVGKNQDQSQFEAELRECRAPSPEVAAISMRGDPVKVATCIGCGCDDNHPCVGEGPDGACSWMRVDRDKGLGVCSACPGSDISRWDAGDRQIRALK